MNGEDEEALERISKSPVSNLPSSLIADDILIKLPLKSIVQFRCVSKTWKNRISDKYFSTLYSKKSPFTLLLQYQYQAEQVGIKFVEIGLDGTTTYTMINLPNILPKTGKNRLIKYSCNGLLCLVHEKEIVYIVNPLIGEVVRLPELIWEYIWEYGHIRYSFGFCKQSNLYKVLRVMQKCLNYLYFDIFTIGVDHKWRSFEDSPFLFDSTFYLDKFQISNEGVVYFISWNSNGIAGIFAFDLEEEKGRMILPPSQLVNEVAIEFKNMSANDDQLSLYDGNICFSYSTPSQDQLDGRVNKLLVIWTLKQQGIVESWSRQAIVIDEQYLTSMCDISFITRLRDGDLFLDGICYNEKTKKFRKCDDQLYYEYYNLLDYVPNFLPLSPDPLQKYRESLNSSNALDILVISDTCSNKSLKEATLNFIVQNMKDADFSERYDAFVRDNQNPHLTEQITKALVMHTTSKLEELS